MTPFALSQDKTIFEDYLKENEKLIYFIGIILHQLSEAFPDDLDNFVSFRLVRITC